MRLLEATRLKYFPCCQRNFDSKIEERVVKGYKLECEKKLALFPCVFAITFNYSSYVFLCLFLRDFSTIINDDLQRYIREKKLKSVSTAVPCEREPRGLSRS